MLNVVLSVAITFAILGLLRLLRRAAWRRRCGPAAGWMARRLARRLDATPEQERLLREEVEALRMAVSELRGDLLASREDLARALGAERLDPADLESLTAGSASRLEALRSRLGASLARVHQALDARQRQVLAELVRSGPHRRRAHGHA